VEKLRDIRSKYLFLNGPDRGIEVGAMTKAMMSTKTETVIQE
jgi:hypothetical protein